MILAVSGGPDSLAMLLLAHSALPNRIDAATMDHGLRPEAAGEAEFVRELCSKLGIRHHILHPAQPITGSVQAEARQARYAALSALATQTQCQWIATAHHADDQLETLLMRIARGSGVDGLAAVRHRQGNIIRPMLGFKKTELNAICDHCGVTPVHDPSNADDRFDRVAMRQWLAAHDHPFDADRAVRTTKACADAAEALNWSADQLYDERVQQDGDAVTVKPEGIPAELLRRIVARLLDAIQPGYVPRGEALDEALQSLAKGQICTLGNIMCRGGADWRFTLAPRRRF
jgi:tRNA(Ile)-lysidine synthase